MKELKQYTIPFVGLKLGTHRFDFAIDNEFFKHFEYDEFNNAKIALKLSLEKQSTLLDLQFEFDGTVNLPCDVTNEPYDQAVAGSFNLVVKFGPEFNNEQEELLILPHGSYEVSVEQYVYESIVLSLPAKRIHPGVIDGTLESEVLKRLEALSPKGENLEENDPQTDPRWDELKKLLTDKQ